MARGRRAAVVAASALVVAYNVEKAVFVPAPSKRALAAAPAVAAALAAAAPAHAVGGVLCDDICRAAEKLSEESYPYLKEIDWNSYVYLSKPGAVASAGDWAKAIAKAIDMGTKMDPNWLKRGVIAHADPIGKLTDANPVLSLKDYTKINNAIGHMIASVPESVTLDVYNAFAKLVSSDVPPYMMSKVKESDARKAYEAFWAFKDVVKSNPVKPFLFETPRSLGDKLVPIDVAAKDLSKASYPFIKEVDWDSEIFAKPIPGVTPVQMMKALDPMLVMGSKVDTGVLRAAAAAHVTALNNMDDKLVATEADYAAINAGIGKMMASVPQSVVMDVYNAMEKVLDPAVPNNMFSKVVSNDALAAYGAFLNFKDVVKAAQR